ncbi:RidA family protein [Nisaea sediminum]|uniref:RidA family protein n=1 Tax=Nisaea sediminum TaxID=2775867 RepID=UPI001866B160|nr:RidA family protein [Nisaea sediminum]
MTASFTTLNPDTLWQVPEAFTPVYAHATEVTDGQKMLFVSGQFGVRPDGSLPEDFTSQAAQAMANVEALLAASRMSFANVAKLTFFLTRSGDAPDLVKLRTEKWGKGRAPAVTVLTVSALARSDYLIEIEAVAVN